MNIIKLVSFSLLFSSAVLTSAFAMDPEQDPNAVGSGGSLKRPRSEQEDNTPNKSARTDEKRVEKEAPQATVQNSITTFPSYGKFGDLSFLPTEIMLYSLNLADNPRSIMLVNWAGYTLATGYRPERQGLRGCGPDKRPDYPDALFSLASEKCSNIFRECRVPAPVDKMHQLHWQFQEGEAVKDYPHLKGREVGSYDFLSAFWGAKFNCQKIDRPGVYILDNYLNTKDEQIDIDWNNGDHVPRADWLDYDRIHTLPSVLWYMQFTELALEEYAADGTEKFINELNYTNIKELRSTHDYTDKYLSILSQEKYKPSKLEKIYCTNLFDIQVLGSFLASLKNNHPDMTKLSLTPTKFSSSSLSHLKDTKVHTLTLVNACEVKELHNDAVIDILSNLANSNVRTLSLKTARFQELDRLDVSLFLKTLKITGIETLKIGGSETSIFIDLMRAISENDAGSLKFIFNMAFKEQEDQDLIIKFIEDNNLNYKIKLINKIY